MDVNGQVLKSKFIMHLIFVLLEGIYFSKRSNFYTILQLKS